jgi:iron uptake system EfeUOB component EfeO/EfeM
MERTMWTDERLDDLSRRMDAGFERVDKDIRELRGDVGSLRLAIFQVGGGLGVGLIGVIASILISGG